MAFNWFTPKPGARRREAGDTASADHAAAPLAGGDVILELRDLAIEKSTLTRRIDAAVRLGLVERTPDPHDARARLVALTADGRERLTALQREQTARWRRRLSTWDPADVEQLTALLRRLGDGLD